jgi:hypothetical protein
MTAATAVRATIATDLPFLVEKKAITLLSIHSALI